MTATVSDAATYVRTTSIPLDQLTPFPGNAKRGNVDAILTSLRRNAQYRSLVVREITHGPLIVLAGNHTMQALTTHGPGPCTYTTPGGQPCAICHNQPWEPAARCEIITCDDATARRINLADNRTSELGTYDNDALAELLTGLDDLDGTGYTDEDLQLLTAGPLSLDQLADTYGEPDDADLWPTLTFKVAPDIRDAFYALTIDCDDPNDDNARFACLLDRARAGEPM